MHFINIILAFLLPLLALAQDTTIGTSTQTLTRTIRVSQISTLTFTSFSSSATSSAPSSSWAPISLNATSTFFPATPTTQTTLVASSPAAVVSAVATTSQPAKGNFMGAAPALSASNVGMAGFVMVAVAALL